MPRNKPILKERPYILPPARFAENLLTNHYRRELKNPYKERQKKANKDKRKKESVQKKKIGNKWSRRRNGRNIRLISQEKRRFKRQIEAYRIINRD
jgi:hypothetical protein